MYLHPTRAAIDVAVVGMAVAASGVVFRQPTTLAWGAALLLGIAVARAVTLLSVAKIRASGFEMLWRDTTRCRRVARGHSVELDAEVRNRDAHAARYVELRAVASPDLEVTITPNSGEVPAGGRLRATVSVRALRVGRHGIHGLSLEVRGSPGLFEVPLTFSNPYGLEVMPAAYGTALRTARGGRSRASAEDGRPGPLPGDGLELREIRELVPGDPFKRIAWKATARRGKLLVREYEREERDVVWLLLDASVELWAGAPGTAPLDIAIDEVAAAAAAHLGHGDRVGLAVAGARPLAVVLPDKGVRHGTRIMETLALATGTLDADRSDLDTEDVAARVAEHLRPLDPKAAASVGPRDPDRLAARVSSVADARAPFASMELRGPTVADRRLRDYLARFGIGSPPRQEPDGPRADGVLVDLLQECTQRRPRASVVYLWSPSPGLAPRQALETALAKRQRRGLTIRWIPMRFDASLPRRTAVANAVAEALDEKAQLLATHGEHTLRALGVSVERIRSRTGRTRAAPPPDERVRQEE